MNTIVTDPLREQASFGVAAVLLGLVLNQGIITGSLPEPTEPATIVAPAPKPAPVPAPVVQAPKPAPVFEAPKPAPKPAPVVVETPKPAPVVVETPKPAPVVVEAPKPAPVVVPAPKPAPVVVPAPKPAPVVVVEAKVVAEEKPTIAKPAEKGALGDVSRGSASGGKILPKEEISADTLSFLKKYSSQ